MGNRVASDKVISFKLSENVLDQIDFFVEEGYSRNRSEFVREAIMYKLRKLGYKI